MSNGFTERQNKEKNIKRLAAARQLYSNAETIESVILIFSVILPLFLSSLKIFISSDIFKNASNFYSLSMFVISFVLRDLTKKFRIIAADIQQDFDLDVFNMKWNNEFFGEHRNNNENVINYYKKIYNNNIEKEKLYNWYAPLYDELPLLTGIISCQNENIRWDRSLRIRYLIFLFLVFLCFTFLPIIICVSLKKCLLDFLLLFSPVYRWCIDTIYNIFKNIKEMKKLEELVQNNTKISMKLLQKIQGTIYKNRKQNVKIPDWFYWMFKNRDEHKEMLISQFENEK